jgi:mitogen-activated protein kinase 1/3
MIPGGAQSKRETYAAHVNEVDFVVDVRYVNLIAVGGGSYGLVCSATDTVTGQQVAIKKVTNCFRDSSNAKRIVREIKVRFDA